MRKLTRILGIDKQYLYFVNDVFDQTDNNHLKDYESAIAILNDTLKCSKYLGLNDSNICRLPKVITGGQAIGLDKCKITNLELTTDTRQLICRSSNLKTVVINIISSNVVNTLTFSHSNTLESVIINGIVKELWLVSCPNLKSVDGDLTIIDQIAFTEGVTPKSVVKSDILKRKVNLYHI